MTSRTTEIQRLIADIEGLLTHKGKRLHRVLAQEQSAREILEKVRAFLVSLQESDAVMSRGETDGEQQQQLSPLLARFINQSSQLSPGEEAQTSGELGVSPRTDLRSFLEPLQLEMQTLLQERAKLVEEIRQLEQKRLQNYSLAQQVANQEKMISEFLQVLMNRIRPNVNYNADVQQEELEAQVGQKALPQFDANSSSVPSSNLNPEASIVSTTPALSNSLDRLQQLTRLTSDLDHRLLALDSTVNAVFNALERNILTYHDSLSQSLSRMHSKGVQGENLLTNLIDNLSQRLRFDNTTQNTPQNQTTLENHTNFTNLNSLPSPTEDIQLSAFMAGNQTESEISDNPNSIPDLDSVLSDLDNFDSDTPDTSLGSKMSENPGGSQFEGRQRPQTEESTSNEVDDLYASLFGTGDFVQITENNNLQESNHQTAKITEIENENLSRKINTYAALESDIHPGETSTVGNEIEDTVESEDVIAETSVNIETTVSSETEDNELITETDFNIADIQAEIQAEIQEKLAVEKLESLAPQIEVPTEPYEQSLIGDTEEYQASSNTELSSIESSNIESANPEIETQEDSNRNTENTPPDTVTATDIVADMWNTFSFEEDEEIKVSKIKESGENIVKKEVLPSESDKKPESDNLPNSQDTITALTDLLAGLGIQGDMFEVETISQANNIKDLENQEKLEAVDLAKNTEDKEQISTSSSNSTSNSTSDSTTTSSSNSTTISTSTSNHLDSQETSDNYLPASPEENLLARDQAQTDTSKLDISLNPEQQRQLDWDLTNFDAEQTPQSQPGNQVDNSAPPSTNANDLPKLEISAWETSPAQSDLNPTEQCADTQLDLSPTLGLNEEIENQNIATTDSQTSNLSSGTGDYDLTEVNDKIENSVWYLGIDLGTTGISAVLLNRSTQEVYPLYWSTPNQTQLNSVQRSFRLPAEVYLPSSILASEETLESSRNKASQTEAKSANPNHNLFSAYLKPYLQVALSYKNNSETSFNKGRNKWEPLLQLNELSSIPLVWVVRSLSKLLLTFKSDRKSTTLGLTAAADGLPSKIFEQIINNLAGVICTCPSNSSEQYRFNVREALLTSKLIHHPQQVFFIEEAVAGLLSELDGARGEIVNFRGSKRSLFTKTSSHAFVGNTLIVNIGASATEMGLVDVPQNLHELTHNKFMLHNFFYAGKAIEQDIVCQLLIPEKWRESRLGGSATGTTQTNRSWKPSVPGLEQMRLSSLGLDKLELPRPGEADTKARIRLQQRLESSVLGQAILNAAGALKLILQHQESFTIELADQRWVLHRRDLESQVFVPFVRRLNREINRLLVARGIPTEAVDQAILTGGVASLGSVSRWLRQKLPNAKIIQDSYLGEDNTPKCTRIAYGLALLTLHPQVLEIPRQQYTDYFLFTELLQVLPQRAVSFGEIIQLFEGRGINTRSCQQRLLAFLEGKLPQGLIPEAENSQWITYSSSESTYYKTIASAPLFEKQGSLTYRPNLEQVEHLRRYLDVIQASTQQSLKEPYTVNFVVGVQKD